MKEFACFDCNAEFDESEKIKDEVKCPKCGAIHKMFCGKCHKPLGTHIGEEHIRGVCDTCTLAENEEQEAQAEEDRWESPPEIPDPTEPHNQFEFDEEADE